MSDRAARFEVAIFCPECEEFHRVMAWTIAGRFPSCISIAAGPGSGWHYLPSGEDLGADGGASVPVYRAFREDRDARLPPRSPISSRRCRGGMTSIFRRPRLTIGASSNVEGVF